MLYPVDVRIEAPPGLPDLDELQRAGVTALLGDVLESAGVLDLGGNGATHLRAHHVTAGPEDAGVALSIDAPDLETAEEIGRRLVTEALAHAAPLAGWRVTGGEVRLRTEVAAARLAAADGPGAPADDPAARVSRAPSRSSAADDAAARAALREHARRLRAFGLDAFGYDDESPSPDVGEEAALLAAGALMHTVEPLLDTLFDDLGAGAGAAVFDRLPAEFAEDYDEDFARRFLVAAVTVTGRLAAPHWEAPACLAEEQALWLIVDEAEDLLTRHGLADDDTAAAFATFTDAAFDDPGIEEALTRGAPGRSAPGPGHWFTPVRPGRVVHPYLRT